jgi:hypothetical protein
MEVSSRVETAREEQLSPEEFCNYDDETEVRVVCRVMKQHGVVIRIIDVEYWMFFSPHGMPSGCSRTTRRLCLNILDRQ